MTLVEAGHSMSSEIKGAKIKGARPLYFSGKGQLKGAGDKPVSPEQMELARLRAELSRVKMERDILKKATAYFARESL